MLRSGSLLVHLILTGGCGSPPSHSLSGLVRTHGGAPMAESRLVVKAEADDPACRVFETTTDAQGRFELEAVCADGPYAYATGDQLWQLSPREGDAGLTLEARFEPATSGAWLVSGADVTRLWPSTPVQLETVGGVEVPWVVPPSAGTPLLGREGTLVLAGEASEQPAVEPVLPEPARRRWYVGYASGVPDTPQRMPVSVGDSLVLAVHREGRTTTRVPSSALPGGRYALRVGEADTVAVFDNARSLDGADVFGSPPAADQPEAQQAE